MVGISFDDKHSYFDYGLVLSSKTIESPSVKSQTVDVAGGDGVLDLTDFFGEAKFSNRKLTFIFSKVQNQSEFVHEWSYLQNDLNGKKVKITLDEEPDFYYMGRVSMSYTREATITTITIKCDCEPYKLSQDLTNVVIMGSGTAVLSNLRKRVVPTIVTTNETTLEFGNKVINLSAGEWVVPELELVSGNNEVKVTSNGTTSFSYREGGL